MPRKGRETEVVLKELESISLKDQAEIKSPDFIYDVVTGKPREVDVSIRIKVGTHEFLTIIECRDRKGKQDVTWIEQIVTKTKNLQANKVVAVSTHGFTEGAKKLAAHENVVLRLLRDFNAEEVEEWMSTINLTEQNWEVVNIKMELGDDSLKDKSSVKMKEILYEFILSEKKIKVDSTGEYVSIIDLINRTNYNNDNFLFKDLNDSDLPVINGAILNSDPENKFFIDIHDKTYYIKFIEIELKCWVEEKVIPLKNALRYEENDKPVLDKANYEFPTSDKKQIILSITRDHETDERIVKGYTENKEPVFYLQIKKINYRKISLTIYS